MCGGSGPQSVSSWSCSLSGGWNIASQGSESPMVITSLLQLLLSARELPSLQAISLLSLLSSFPHAITVTGGLACGQMCRCAGSADAAPHYNVLLHARGPTGVKAFCVSTWTQHFTVHLSFITSSFPNHLINIIRLTPKCTKNSRDKKERRQKDAVSLRAAALAQRHQNERGCWCELTWATTEQCEIILAGLERTKLWVNIDEGLTWCSSTDLRMCG